MLGEIVCFCNLAYSQNFIHVNQLGYYANGPKVAMISDMEADSYTIRDYVTNSLEYSGDVEESKYWSMSGEQIQMIDFSSFKKPGNYYIQIGSGRSYPFKISSENVYDSLSVWSMKAFYLWRASCPIKKEYATFKGISFARPEGHPDDVVYIHRSAANEKRHIESEYSSPKGWYDAGDYNKYVVNAGYSAMYLVMAYELYKDYYKSLDTNIPESSNEVPDILDELKWELDWLLTMQDPMDGGVNFKLSSLSFSKAIMPDKDDSDRYIIGKSTTSTLNFVSIMSAASRIFVNYDFEYKGYGRTLQRAALKAYEWAQKNPSVVFHNPSDVTTGEYLDENFSDEFFLANVELFLTTNQRQYYDRLKLNQFYDSPTWSSENSLGLMELMINKDTSAKYVDYDLLNVKFRALADNIYKQYYYSFGKLPLKKFEWGSNGDVAVNGCILGLAYNLFHEHKYLMATTSCFDYLLGRNSLDYCFVTQFGSHYPRHLHDRRCESDGIYEPLPGYLCGGPNKDQMTDCGQSNYPTSVYPARTYLDEECSYSTNEVAINWNAPLVMLTGIVINELEKLK